MGVPKSAASTVTVPLAASATSACAMASQLSPSITRMGEFPRRSRKSPAPVVLLATIPGIGPITALTLAIEIDAAAFESGRHLASWIGLTPKEHSTGGKQRMGGISRAGNERLRQLLVLGATSVIAAADRPGSTIASAWLLNLLKRKPRKVAAVALANKMARIVWAMMKSGEVYRSRPAAATAAAAA